jgi:hypothetical protein
MEPKYLALLVADLTAQRVIIDRVFTLLLQRSLQSNLNRAVQVKPQLDKDFNRFLEVLRSLT